MEAASSEETSTSFQCPNCDFTANDAISLESHKRDLHELIICECCDKIVGIINHESVEPNNEVGETVQMPAKVRLKGETLNGKGGEEEPMSNSNDAENEAKKPRDCCKDDGAKDNGNSNEAKKPKECNIDTKEDIAKPIRPRFFRCGSCQFFSRDRLEAVRHTLAFHETERAFICAICR